MLDPPDEDVTGRRLVVYVPDEMDLWSREHFVTTLAATDSTLADHFRTTLQTALETRVRFEQVDVLRPPDALALTRQRFRLVERRHETTRVVGLPVAGTVLSDAAGAPDYVVFLDPLEFVRLSSTPEFSSPGVHGPPMPGQPGAVPVFPGMRARYEGEWRTGATLWDNRAGAPVFLTPVRGEGPLMEVRDGALGAARPTGQTWTESIADLADEMAEGLRLARTGASDG